MPKTINKTDRWCFTYNTVLVVEDVLITQRCDVVKDMWTPRFSEDVEYLVWQWEVSPSTNRLHVQGYVRFPGRKTMKTVKKYFGEDSLHLEPARGSEEECKLYCTKEDTRFLVGGEYGTYKKEKGLQGHRTDLDSIAKEIVDGKSLREIGVDHPAIYIHYYKGLENFAEMIKPAVPEFRDVQVCVIWGETGVGKTWFVTHRDKVYKTIVGKRNPWDGYKGEEAILLDEFNTNQISPEELNTLLDGYKLDLAARYYDRPARYTRIYITANSDPTDWYRYCDGKVYAAVQRRITGKCWNRTDRDQKLEDMQNK